MKNILNVKQYQLENFNNKFKTINIDIKKIYFTYPSIEQEL